VKKETVDYTKIAAGQYGSGGQSGATSLNAVFTANGYADFSATVFQQSTLTAEPDNALAVIFNNPDHLSQSVDAMTIDQSGDAYFAGISISSLFTSGVAYVDNNYIYSTSSGSSLYALDYALFGGEGREEFGSSPTVFRFYLKDHLVSTRAVWAPELNKLINATGYLPYGTQVPIISTAGENTREKFTGKELDKDGMDATDKNNTITGVRLDYFGKRYYDAEIGRWLSTDLLHQFYNPYSYGLGNPISGIDPDGLYLQYNQSTGGINYVYNAGSPNYGQQISVGTGYAGAGMGLNCPAMQNVPFVGPLPAGNYTIGPMQNNETSSGKILYNSMFLTPNAGNYNPMNRQGFLIHGDNAAQNNSASEGCIVASTAIRNQIANSGDNSLKVISGTMQQIAIAVRYGFQIYLNRDSLFNMLIACKINRLQ
jgi:RHS repeat-associated protein